MIIFPAIDIIGGKVVRLIQGHFNKMKEYANDPIEVAKKWESMGVEWLHVVDLDGAQIGEPKNTEMIINIAKSVNIPIQVGGGIRSKSDIAKLFDNGISRVILGTKILEDRVFLNECAHRWHGRIAISLDCKEGYLAQRAWTHTSNIQVTEFVKTLAHLDLACLIYTDISRDGMLTGPNFKGIDALMEATKHPIIASGGISNIDDIKKLKLLYEPKGLLGAITGKAIYEGALDVKEALAISKTPHED